MDIDKVFAIDENKELTGVWEDLGDDASILVARVGNKNYVEAYRTIPRGLRRMIENGILSGDKLDQVICDLLATTILLDWKGIEFQGASIKYSHENAMRVLLALPEFREMVWELANEFRRFHNQSIEEDLKNSQTASDGKSVSGA